MQTKPEHVDKLEELLDGIRTGAIEALVELDADEIEMLRAACAEGESVEDMFDRLRGSEADVR